MKNPISKTAFVWMVSVLMMTACASQSTSSGDGGETSSHSESTKGRILTTGEIRDKYTISQLDSIRNALEVIAKSAEAPEKDSGTEILGCPVTGAKAKRMMGSVRSLIEGRIGAERDAYSLQPVQYGDTHSFETCAASCSCGVLNEVVRGARTSGLKKGDQKYHERWAARLKLKAQALSEREQRACAIRQTWFCGSDLHRYLENQGGGEP